MSIEYCSICGNPTADACDDNLEIFGDVVCSCCYARINKYLADSIWAEVQQEQNPTPDDVHTPNLDAAIQRLRHRTLNGEFNGPVDNQ